MKEQKYRYVGDLDPITKMRHGKGVYTYPNKFFQYEGEWRDGVRQGKGVFRMADGIYYEGDFDDGEITGAGVKKWPSGRMYIGGFMRGEQHGEGKMCYPNGEEYEGNWHLNVRQGKGRWKKANGDVIEGEFKAHYPTGECKVTFASGDTYEGSLDKSGLNGVGKYTSEKKNFTYEGEFNKGRMCGKGKYVSEIDQYTYEGEFKDDKPVLLPNKILLVRTTSEDLKKQEDARAAEYAKKKKAKKDPKKKGTEKVQLYPDEEQYSYRIYWGFGGAPVSFDLQMVFQGESYIDPAKAAQKEEEMKEAKGKGKKKDAKDEPEVIVPDPLLVAMESRRRMQLRMAKTEVQKDEASGEDKEVDVEYSLVDKSDPSSPFFVESDCGVIQVKDLTYEKTEIFDEGCYVITVTDVTQSQPHSRLPETKIALVISQS